MTRCDLGSLAYSHNFTSRRLLDRLRDALRLKHCSLRTERTYVDWVRRFILVHGRRHPDQIGSAEIQAVLTPLAVDQNGAASTQTQALSALVLLYRFVRELDLDEKLEPVRAKKLARLPVVLSKPEVRAVIAHLSPDYRLMAQLLYDCGLRLMECLRLRVKDIVFEQRQVVVREGKGLTTG